MQLKIRLVGLKHYIEGIDYMIDNITDYNYCTGCMLCKQVCNNNAIEMYVDEEGFSRPKILTDKCIDCFACKNICPQNVELKKVVSSEIYLAQNNDPRECKTSTSGGIATAISKNFIENGGIVYGAAFDNDMRVEHIRVSTVLDCNKIKGSKYVQSDISKVYDMIKEDIKKKEHILFIGVPCQCAAIKKYFQNYDNLYICDLICNGVGSPKIWIQHKKYLERKFHCKMKNYIFRPKENYYLEPYEYLVDSEKKEYKLVSPWEKYGTIYYNGVIMRPCCYECNYTTLERISDLTFCDAPLDQITNTTIIKNDVKKYGLSGVMVNTAKGKLIFESTLIKISKLRIRDLSKERLLASIKCPEHRNTFFYKANDSLETAKLSFFGRKYKIKCKFIKLLKK